MKNAKALLIKVFVAVAMLLLANRSHALTAPYLIQLSNDMAGYQAYLSTIPEAASEVKALGRALKDLSKPSSTVADDYSRYFIATLHLGTFAFTDPIVNGGGVYAFTNFMNDAFAKFVELNGRNEALNDFVKTRKSASNTLAQVDALLLANAVETNQQTGLIRGGQIFKKLVKAEKLVIKGEANQGFAPDDDDLAGGTLNYEQRDESGTIEFTSETEYTHTIPGDETTVGTYTYTRTGLNTAIVVLTELGGARTTTVKATFKSLGEGRFTLKFTGPIENGHSAGRFTFTRVI